MSLFKSRLLKKLKINNRKLFKDRKTYLNAIIIFNTYTPITKTKGVKSHAESLTIKLKKKKFKF